MSEAQAVGADKIGVPPARPAATVILVRQADAGFEVLMVRRLASASAFADAFVFPGGVVRPDDGVADPLDAGFSDQHAFAALTVRGGEPPRDAALARAVFRAGIRELFEEAGVLLARDASGQTLRIPRDEASRWADLRDALQAGRIGLSDILRRERLIPDYQRLAYFSHWITPDNAPRRFDTRFFAAEMPPGQTAVHCQIETTESVWIQPREALERAAAGNFPLVYPTRMHLRRLTASATPAEFLALARAKSIQTVRAKREVIAGVERIWMTGEDDAW